MLLRCRGTDPAVRIPEQISGRKIRRIAAYAFSSYKQQEESEPFEVVGTAAEGSRLLAGDQIESVELPATVEAVGNYAFYGCTAWRKLIMTDRVSSFGAGAFIDCRLTQLEVHFQNGSRSCLKDVLEEVRTRMTVDLYMEAAGEVTQARLCFPEYYEEDVENGPARIFEVHYLGTGYKYRQCFYDREVDYRTYDQLFPLALANEDAAVIYDIAASRLLYPYQLSRAARAQYEQYLKERPGQWLAEVLRRDDMELLYYISERKLWQRAGISAAVEQAAAAGRTEILSYLMQEMHRQFPPQKKDFTL